MKVLLVVTPLVLLYLYFLFAWTEVGLQRAITLNTQYQHVTAAADQWSAGDSSVSFVPGT